MSNTPTFRLAFRQEGRFWNCYLAEMHTMDRAQLIGSLLMTLAQLEPANAAFREAMKTAADALLQAETGGTVVGWNTQEAPQHERAGSA